MMMGQFITTPWISTSPTSRVMFDVEGDNGLMLYNRYLPVELLVEIFCRADCKTLLTCQLVCKRWQMMIQKYVWHKKAEQTLGKAFPWHEDVPWSVFYFICKKQPYERNLMKNHSGMEGMDYWTITYNSGDCWTVEEPPAGVPELPTTELMFKERHTCFTTSFHTCIKEQSVDLVAEGIHPYVLDTMQPSITVSEWYSCRWDCPAIYQLKVRLLKDEKDTEVLDEFQFHDILEGDKQNKWLHVSHVFKNYGSGVRVITFEHGGKDRSYWAGHYGSKMAGACIFIEVPSNNFTCDNEDLLKQSKERSTKRLPEVTKVIL
ncbi:F-box only protein 44-like isoform X2 [Pogonomyrmex barbatus]|uniref:F-box only protein 44-like isoform X2 n=1 Tax=Pogonomyrmex barbatus TaxID=144034 RepID=A0A6I9WMP1_9HYME|nr:F-box only protein 44-like isoform X2 [Pogonomyrmex barbatus]